ncbi:hypothetical protein P3T40_004839 [Paraburkholderia sp. EB58]|jgi:hypothetical protein
MNSHANAKMAKLVSKAICVGRVTFGCESLAR